MLNAGLGPLRGRGPQAISTLHVINAMAYTIADWLSGITCTQ